MSEPRKREEKIGPSLRRRRGYVERDEREEDGMARGGGEGEGGGREEKGNVVERRRKGQMDKREGWVSSEGVERPTPCTCVTVRPRTRRRVLISQRAPRRRASFCEPCFFRRCTARSDEGGEGARESRTVREREGGGGGGGAAVVKAGCKECHDLAQQTSPA
ncbi:hypothetical protein ALC57_17804 [Trachymyrmex cornetzi]|uniref:Uncharacterized protein n=1 Tax=Trachymyrmex cornetzi TaxID=471704 RepID=A0A195DCH1_9HYME|nr:hypothetical protein ALC57_17804 [Trachymyrmex cornetzi]